MEGGTGVVAVFLEALSGTVQIGDAESQIHGRVAGERFGTVIDATHDLDGGGWIDLVFGVPSSNGAATDAGAVYFIASEELF